MSLWVQLVLVPLVMKARLVLKHGKGRLLCSCLRRGIPVALLKSQSPPLTQPSAGCRQIIVLPCLRGLGWASAQGMFLKVVEVSVLQELYAFRWPLLLLNSSALYRACPGPTALSQRRRCGPYHLSSVGLGLYMLQKKQRREGSWRHGCKDTEHEEETRYYLPLNISE